MSKIAHLILKGFLQGIGFRAYVKLEALRLDIKGTVKNLPDGSIEIYGNAPDEMTYNKFKEIIKAGEGEVKEIIEYFKGSDGYGEGPKEWIGFQVIRDEYSSLEESMEFVVLGGRQMLEKQDQTLDAIKEMDQHLSGKHDQTLDVIKDTNQSIKNMDQHMNEEFNELDQKYDKFGNSLIRLEGDMKDIKSDIHEMREAFTKMVDHFVKDDK